MNAERCVEGARAATGHYHTSAPRQLRVGDGGQAGATLMTTGYQVDLVSVVQSVQ